MHCPENKRILIDILEYAEICRRYFLSSESCDSLNLPAGVFDIRLLFRNIENLIFSQ